MFVIDAIENFDVLIFSILLDITMYLFLRRQRFSRSRSTKLYLALILSVAAAAAIETAAWLFTDPNNPSLRSAQYALNVLYFSTNILPASFGLRYLDYIVSQSEEKSRRKLHLFLAPVYMNIVFVIVNFFADGFLFSVDSANIYHRGIAAYIGNGVTLLFALVIVLGLFRNRRMITGRMTQVILTLTLLPVSGVVLQMLFLGLSASLPAYTLAIFISFLLMERNELLKDPLTLLNSRVQMENRLQFKLRSQDPFTAIMIDVNGFKAINDIHGHTIGDTVLKDVSRILLSGAKYEDYVCRFGGDEFFVILESKDDIGNAYIKRIDHALETYSKDKPFTTSLSYGLVYVTSCCKYKEVDELVHTTDQLMYQDKANRRQ